MNEKEINDRIMKVVEKEALFYCPECGEIVDYAEDVFDETRGYSVVKNADGLLEWKSKDVYYTEHVCVYLGCKERHRYSDYDAEDFLVYYEDEKKVYTTEYLEQNGEDRDLYNELKRYVLRKEYGGFEEVIG